MTGIVGNDEGAPASPSGSRPSDQAQLHGPDAARFDPSRLAVVAKELGELRDHLKRTWDDVAKSESDSSWCGGWGIEERLNASMFVGKQTTMVVFQALGKIADAIAIEAAAAGETTEIGSTEGESAVGSEASETPNPFAGTTFETRKERALRETPTPSSAPGDA